MLDRVTPPSVQNVPFAFRKPAKQVLRNGIPLYVIEGGGQEVVRVDFVFSVGQWHQNQKLQALFTCRMLREGCQGYSSAAFAEQLDYYGAWLELSVAMNRTFVTLYTLKKFFPQTVDLVQHMLFGPTFPEERLQTIRVNNKAQFMVNMQKGDVLAMRALRANVYGVLHPCGMSAEIEDYDALNTSLLADFYGRYYGSHNCTIYLSGCIDDMVISCIDSLFGGMEWGGTASAEERNYSISPAIARSTVIVHPESVQSSIRMGCLLMDVKEADYLPMRVLNTVLGGYFGSRLMKNVRENNGYTYHIGSDLITNTSQVMFMMNCEALADKTEEVICEVRREMQRLQMQLVSDEELRMVRNYMTGEICRNYEGAFSLTDAYIFMEHLGLSQTHIEDTLEAIQTTDAVRLQQLAQQYFHPELLYMVVVRP